MIEIRKFFDKTEAEIITDFLEKNGIPCFLSSDDSGGTRPHLGLQTGYRLLVNENFVEEAERIISMTKNSKKIEPWTCQCGQVIQGQFSSCWNCGKDRT